MVELDQFKYTLSTYVPMLKELGASLNLDAKKERIAELSRYMLAQIYATKLMGMDKSTQKQRIFDFIEALKSNDIKKANDTFDMQIGKEQSKERDRYISNSIWNLQKDVLTFQENEVLKEKTAGTTRTISKEDEKEPEM